MFLGRPNHLDHPHFEAWLYVVDRALARVQARIDTLAGQFANIVASSRGLAPAAVMALEAGCRYGAEAVTSGLADGVLPLATVLRAARDIAAEPAPAPSSDGANAARRRLTRATPAP